MEPRKATLTLPTLPLAAALSFWLALALSCAHGLSADAIALRVQSNVPDATVWIDDVLVGTAKDWNKDGRQIRPGFHRIEVRHPGYYSFFQEVEVAGGSKVVVNATLRELIE